MDGARKLPRLVSRSFFPWLLDSLSLNGYGVEVGVWRGEFSEYLLSESGLAKLISVDAWDASLTLQKKYRQVDFEAAMLLTKDKLKRFGKRSEVLRLTSKDAAKQFPDNYFDFVYIDAGHDYDNVKQDLTVWYPKLKPGGLFAGHDYVKWQGKAKTWGVVRAVNEFIEENDLSLVLTQDKKEYRSWYCLK